MKLQTAIWALLFISLSWNSGAQNIERIEPANWWIGMKNPNVQLLVYGKDISSYKPRIEYKGVTLNRVIHVESSNYLFLDLNISKNALAGEVQLQFKKPGATTILHNWKLLDREPGSAEREGFDQSDVMYLITPDRFSNGNSGNDNVTGMTDSLNRKDPSGRHGGDIQGIRNQLDYLSKMGFTAIWLNPVVENNMKQHSYHGYAATDFYRIDPRYGSNEEYRTLADEAAKMGIKLIMDMIVNHCGSEHWWMKDPPSSDWINQWPEYTETNHQKTVWQDPYVSDIDLAVMARGWFVPTMPDMNQRNALMATYLIQNSIWWVEYARLAGIRMDTYPYPEMDFMGEWSKRLMEEYPNLYIVGEEWNENPSIVAFWQRGKENPNGFVSHIPGVLDFPLQFALAKALSEKGSWKNLYDALALDFIYSEPHNLVIFPDNHDMPRFFAQIGEDPELFKLGLAFTLTTRGIPQMYYGTEILMSSPAERNDGLIRSDFPGGWPDDEINGFTGQGLTNDQKEVQEFTRKLLNWRKKTPAIHTGRLKHYLPKDDLYVYFRTTESSTVMVVLNKSNEAKEIALDRFRESINGYSSGQDVLSGKDYPLNGTLSVPARAPLILELK